MKPEILKDAINAISLEMLSNPEITKEQQIGIILCELGVPTHISGYHFLKEALLIRMTSDDIFFNIGTIYTDIGKKFNTTYSRVERAIRHAIEISAYRTTLFNMIFHQNINILGVRPTNKQYLEQVVLFYKTIIE